MEMEFNKEEYNWIDTEVVGMSLLMIGGTIDSYGEQIKGNVYYIVGKHKSNGLTAILPTKRNQLHEFANKIMKQNNKFN